jgi:hypothetical protein
LSAAITAGAWVEISESSIYDVKGGRMTKKYDVKDVDAYMADVRTFKALARVELWLVLQGDTLIEGYQGMRNMFHRQSLAVQANILYRFESIMKEAALEAARAKAQEARRVGDM